MSPWGKMYLESVEYNPGWWDPFGSWRMYGRSGLLEHVIEAYRGARWSQVSYHLDQVEKELRNPKWSQRCE